MSDIKTLGQVLQLHPEIAPLLDVVGMPYSWGAGSLKDAVTLDPLDPLTWPKGLNGGRGGDCSFLAQWTLLRLGVIGPTQWSDLRALDLANACDAIDPAEAGPKDLYFYGKPGKVWHVTSALGGGLCLHFSGNSKTNGNNPSKAVQIVHYTRAGDFLVAGRLKAQHRIDV